ncbi:MAG: hypothetical protein FJZ16_03905 [Candidatus Omnitrophica bacterium]|nr:hypothetical protein [Candidatus Omnitrophota bacterium]
MKINEEFKEVSIVVAVILGLIILQWRLWISGELCVTHDSIIWYGIFSYFVDCLHNGFLPLWNPYMNCGEAFFLNINVLHLLDPSTLFLVLFGKFIRVDLLSLYHYDLLLRYVIFTLGSYLFFRYVARYKISAIISFIILTFSSLATSYLRQHAFMLAFYLSPWILLSLIKFLEGHNKAILWAAFFLGIAIYSYHSMFVVLSVTILVLCILVSSGFQNFNYKLLFKNCRFIIGACLIFIFLSANLIPVYKAYTNDVVPTVRIYEAPLAARSFPADFFNLLTSYSFILHFFNWNYMSESFQYIGLIPILFLIIGILYSNHRYKVGFMIASIITALLMLGDNYFIYPFLHRFLPIFSIIRNTHTFNIFFIFCLLYFVCIGLDVIVEATLEARIETYRKPIFLLTFLVLFLALLLIGNLFRILPSLIRSYQILEGYLMPVTKEMEDMIIKFLFKSSLNLFLFATSSVVMFFILKIRIINVNVKYITITGLILIDLFLFNKTVFEFVTMPRDEIIIPSSTKPVYNDSRLALIQPRYPFYAFVPSILKIFTAYSTKIPWVTTHFYEMKNFYQFANNQQIPEDVKNIFMGITSPRLRMVHNTEILLYDEIIDRLKEIDTNTAEKTIFLEKKQFADYYPKDKLASLNDKVYEQDKIKVLNFSPNGITVRTHAGTDGFLYYSDGYDNAWRVFIDGKEDRVYRANLAFKSVFVSKGSHIVRFIYSPNLYKFSLLCYLFGLVFMLFYLPMGYSDFL